MYHSYPYKPKPYRLRSVRLPVRAYYMRSLMTAEAVPPPKSDDCDKVYPEKIQRIVSDISKLSLIETSQLNELLKVGDIELISVYKAFTCIFILQSTLNLSDVPVMAVGATNPTAGQAPDEVRYLQIPICIL